MYYTHIPKYKHMYTQKQVIQTEVKGSTTRHDVKDHSCHKTDVLNPFFSFMDTSLSVYQRVCSRSRSSILWLRDHFDNCSLHVGLLDSYLLASSALQIENLKPCRLQTFCYKSTRKRFKRVQLSMGMEFSTDLI